MATEGLTATTAILNSNFSKEKNELEEGIFKCPFCLKNFLYPKSLIDHLPSHTIPVPEENSQENLRESDNEETKRTPAPAAATKHIPKRKRKGTKKDLHKCPECSYTSVNMFSINRHVELRHNESRPIKCNTCNVYLTSIAHLYQHETLLHNKNQLINGKYPCKTCGKLFKRNALAIHMRSHTGDKPYPCLLCELRFRRPTHLKNHIKTKHSPEAPSRPYACLKCKYRSPSLRCIKLHLKNVHQESTTYKPYACGKCAFRSLSIRGIQIHLRQVHRENPSTSFTFEEATPSQSCQLFSVTTPA